jgi:hypothetical protein
MRWLERTDLAEQQGDRYNFEGDVVLQQGLALLPSFRAAKDGAALPALTVEAEIVDQSALTPARAGAVDGASLPGAATVEQQSAAAPADALIRVRQAAEDRQCAENLRRAHEEQRKHPHTQGSGRARHCIHSAAHRPRLVS